MHRFALLLLLLCTPALAAPFQETQTLNRGTPTGNPLDKTLFPVTPMPLVGVTRYRITVCPLPGFALQSGTVRQFIWNPATARWGVDFDMDIFVTGAGGTNGCIHKGLVTDIRYGYLYPAALNVAVSGGAGVIVRVDPDTYGL